MDSQDVGGECPVCGEWKQFTPHPGIFICPMETPASRYRHGKREKPEPQIFESEHPNAGTWTCELSAERISAYQARSVAESDARKTGRNWYVWRCSRGDHWHCATDWESK